MLKNKKGISPLIATVLIIGFTVALAAVIMTWGQSFSKSMSQSTEQTTDVQLACAQDVQFDVDTVCWDGTNNQLRISVKNNGNRNLVNLTARVKEDATTLDVFSLPKYGDNYPTTVGIAAFNQEIYRIPKDEFSKVTDPSLVTEVEVIPVISVAGKEVTCSNAIAKFGDVVRGEKVSAC